MIASYLESFLAKRLNQGELAQGGELRSFNWYTPQLSRMFSCADDFNVLRMKLGLIVQEFPEGEVLDDFTCLDDDGYLAIDLSDFALELVEEFKEKACAFVGKLIAHSAKNTDASILGFDCHAVDDLLIKIFKGEFEVDIQKSKPNLESVVDKQLGDVGVALYSFYCS